MLRPYLRLFGIPGIGVPMLASVLGALTIGMLELSVLLLIRLETGSFAEAGVMAGAIGVGNACGIVVQGALIDRRGQTVALIPAGLTCMGSLLLLVLAVTGGGPAVAIGVLAFLAGASVPATPSSIRVVAGTMITDPDLRVTAYATIAVTFTLAGVAGPLVVSGLLLVSGPAVAVLVTGFLAGTAGIGFALTGASRRWRPTGTAARRRPRGWATAGMRTLVSGNFGTGTAAGIRNVAVPAVALAHGSAALAGLCFAVSAAGDLLGGVIYGSRPWRVPLERRLVGALAASAVAGVVVAMCIGSIPLLLAALFCGATISSPGGITMSALLDEVAPRGAVTESYATMVSAGLLGGAAGNALGGGITGPVNLHVVFLLAAGITAAVAVLVGVRNRTLAASY